MAAESKEFPLSIVFQTVDRATAGIRAVNEAIASRLGKITAPIKAIGSSLSALGTEAGIPRVLDAFKKVGTEAMALKKAVIGIAVAVGLGGAAVMSMIDHFADLNKVAKTVGLTADSLAQFHFAAEQSGVSAEEFDNALEKMNKNLGDLKAGGGKLKSFLGEISPRLLAQVKAAKSNTEAFDLFAQAMAKIQDPTKRAAFAVAVFGKGGQPLISMLSKGKVAIKELREEEVRLAGDQNEAAASATEIHHAMNRVSAAFDGIKAAIVVGLAPAFEKVSAALTEFVVAHRPEIAAFIKDFGEKLPGRIDALVKTFGDVIGIITPVWNAIGGLKGAAIGLALVITGKLIVAFVQLGIALVMNPIGLVILAIGLLVAAGVALVAHWDGVKSFFADLWTGFKMWATEALQAVWWLIKNLTPIGLIVENWGPLSDWFAKLWDKITGVFEAAWKVIKRIVDWVVDAVKTVGDGISSVKSALGFGDDDEAPGVGGGPGGGGFFSQVNRRVLGAIDPGGVAAAAAAASSTAKIKIDISNAPKGTRVTTDPSSDADVDLTVGYQMLF